MRAATPPLAAALVLLAACAPSPSRSSEGAPAPAVSSSATRRASNELSRAEIETANVATAYDAVQRLRPQYLRSRGKSSINRPAQFAAVFLDGTPVGGLDALRRISAAAVGSIRYLSGSEATQRFGTGYEGGAILVETRR